MRLQLNKDISFLLWSSLAQFGHDVVSSLEYKVTYLEKSIYDIQPDLDL